MGLRAKVILGLVIFLVVFGLRFLCANCQQVELNIPAAGDPNMPQAQLWQAVSTSITFRANPKINRKGSYDSFEEISSAETKLTNPRSETRQRKRRPQGCTTESFETVHWRGKVSDDVIVSSPSSYLNNRRHHIPSPSSSPSSSSSSQSSPKFSGRIREPLAALEQEQKLSEQRDRQRKERIAETSTLRDKSYRKPYSQAKRLAEIERPQTVMKSTEDLKQILKNSGSLSLSEILQQKNLSLDDLLKGKQNALLALQTTTSASPITVNSPPSSRYVKPVRRIPMSYLTSSSSTQRTTTTNVFDQTVTTKVPKVFYPKSSAVTVISTKESIKMTPTPSEETFVTLLEDSRESVEVENVTSETANVADLVTIATLRDNPPVRSTFRKPNKNFSVINRPRLKTFFPSSTTVEPEVNVSISSTEIAREKINDTTTLREPTEIINITKEITSTSAPTTSRRRLPSRSRTRLPFSKYSSNESFSRESSKESSSIELSSSSESGSSENMNVRFKPRGRFRPRPSAAATSQESIEEKLRKTHPDTNLIEDIKPKQVATLEELFGTSLDVRQNDDDKDSVTDHITQLHQTVANERPDFTERIPLLLADLTPGQEVDDRTELLELMEDRRSGGRLFKVLAQRNMTFEELIEHRRRGSSELHLADLLRNRSKLISTNPQRIPQSSSSAEKMDIVTAFENFPHFNLANLKSVKPDEIKTDSQGSSYFTSIVDIEPTDEIYKEGRAMKSSIASMPVMQAQQQSKLIDKLPPPSSKEGSISNFFPHLKTFSLASYTSQENNNYIDHGNSALIASHISPPREADIDDVNRVEDEVAAAHAHDLLDLELSGHGFKRSAAGVESTHISNGIRSAIIASSAIVAVSLVIFLVIFVACRWRQKRKKKLTYAETYNAIKAKLPIISCQSTMKRATNNPSPIMFPGSKNSKLNTMDPNSPEVQEYLFDAMRKPF